MTHINTNSIQTSIIPPWTIICAPKLNVAVLFTVFVIFFMENMRYAKKNRFESDSKHALMMLYQISLKFEAYIYIGSLVVVVWIQILLKNGHFDWYRTFCTMYCSFSGCFEEIEQFSAQSIKPNGHLMQLIVDSYRLVFKVHTSTDRGDLVTLFIECTLSNVYNSMIWNKVLVRIKLIMLTNQWC